MDRPLTDTSLVEFERLYVYPNVGDTLIVGSKLYQGKEDRRKRYDPMAIGIDMQAGEGVDIVQNLEDSIAPSQAQRYRHVECMSMLEHCQRPWLVAANIERMMGQGASIYVTAPFMWRIHGYPSDYWRMTPQALEVLFPNVRWIKTALCSQRVEKAARVRGAKIDGYPHFPRTETAGFGYRV